MYALQPKILRRPAILHRAAGGQGRTVVACTVLFSVELEEILGLADRILVMNGGEIIGELARVDATEEKIGLMMAGVKGEGRA